MNPIIEIKNISKSYSIARGSEQYLALRDVIMNVVRAPFGFLRQKAKNAVGRGSKEVFWALKNVNVSISKGEIVGVIGANGAGKSTLLKVLNKITEPTEGEVVISGKISSLLEVGTGFHPELTGRENIFFSGAILGMKHKEIVNKFDDIVAFAEMQKFLDTPVKRYSSGMQVRLAFSVAVHMEPDILLIDEVLAVGDAAFQKKCLAKIHEVAKRDNRTIMFVSHNLDAVQNLCERAIYLEKGTVKMDGPTNEVVKAYLERQAVSDTGATFDVPVVPNKKYQIRKVVVKNASGLPETKIEAGVPFSIEVSYDAHENNQTFWITLQCVNEYGNIVFVSRDTDKNPYLLAGRKKGSFTSTFYFPGSSSVSLNGGRYFFTIHIDQDKTSEVVVPLYVDDTLRKFHPFPGAILIGEPWKNTEQ